MAASGRIVRECDPRMKRRSSRESCRDLSSRGGPSEQRHAVGNRLAWPTWPPIGKVRSMASNPGPPSDLQRAWGVAPTTSNGVAAMSAERLARLLVGHDATTLLEAASTILDDVENDRFDALLTRLSVADQTTLRTWMGRARAEGAQIAGTPVHPLAVLAATTLALGQAVDWPRSDLIRDDLSRRLLEAALRSTTTYWRAQTAETTQSPPMPLVPLCGGRWNKRTG